MRVQPYVYFDGRCEEAANYYARALGAEITMLMRFKECPDPLPAMPPGSGEKVMHMSLRIGDSEVLASDGRCGGAASFNGFALTLTVADETEAKRLFAALADGGQVRMPLARTFFSPSFGMLADRFGVTWIIYLAG
ncbi:MAG: VOC family protein [Acetobacteraceae bacterium]